MEAFHITPDDTARLVHLFEIRKQTSNMKDFDINVDDFFSEKLNVTQNVDWDLFLIFYCTHLVSTMLTVEVLKNGTDVKTKVCRLFKI